MIVPAPLPPVSSRAAPAGGRPPGRAHHSAVTVKSPVTVKAGQLLDLDVGEVAHGGWCVARQTPGEGFVLFVRHALPGERVRALVTQVTSRFARADAVQVLRPAPERVSPPCPYARPGGCGGCDWQHARPAAQLEFKARVVEQQLRRIAGLEREVTVRPLPGGPTGWRTRVRFAVRPDGLAGLHKHRSAEIVAISDCLIAHPLVTQAEVTRRSWPGDRWVEVAVAPASGQQAVLASTGSDSAPRFLTQHAAGRDWRVAAAGFWQGHPAAADTLATEVLAALAPKPGEIALDLFCGAGLFAGVLATAVGPAGAVIGVEQDADAVKDARHNLRPAPWARIHRGDAAQVIAALGPTGAAIAVADPPRTGLGAPLVGALCAEPALRAIGYVSCDPATMARDIAAFGRSGWTLADLRAFDAFPMTHHVECLAVLEPRSG
jgi:tRNA/tmRNA/rRNA uracil-C5-methylase (TrmA/RlmC/RlmD family)